MKRTAWISFVFVGAAALFVGHLTEKSAAEIPSVSPTAPSQSKPKDMRRKALLTPAEEQSVQASLKDRQKIELAKSILMSAEEQYQPAREVAHFRAVDFLSSAIAWNENPDREYAISAAKEIILSDNFLKPTEIKQRKSLAGDKVELFATLLKTAPDQAREVFAQAQGTPNSKVLTYAKGLYAALGPKQAQVLP